MTMLYMRFKSHDEFKPRPFGPKDADHPTVGALCPACGVDFVVNDYTTLIPLGPGNDAEAQEKASAGRYYNAVCVEVHAECGGISPGEFL